MVLRTANEETCMSCGVKTNAYDIGMGRHCPLCIAERCAKFGKSLISKRKGEFMYSFNPEQDMSYLSDSNKYLLNEPNIDHSNDIDQHTK